MYFLWEENKHFIILEHFGEGGNIIILKGEK